MLPLRPVYSQDDEYGRYLASLVPLRLRSLPHIGTKNVTFLEAEEFLGLEETKPEKFVRCLPGEGSVDVASVGLADVLRRTELESIFERFPHAREGFPLVWLKNLLAASAKTQRYLCAWYRA